MNRLKIATSYNKSFIETDRPQPLTDKKIEGLIQDILSGKLETDISDSVYVNFKKEMESWLQSSKLNNIVNLDSFTRTDICIGCTQFIDSLYMQGPVQVLQGDYRYHIRLGNTFTTVDKLIQKIPLIIALPFPSTGDIHEGMKLILDTCLEKDIPVHIDGAWVTCCRNINFNFNHPAIISVAISLSKGLGLGWNRIGLRWTRNKRPDAISIMNDFHMNNRALVMIGLHFLRNLKTDHLWINHASRYYQICKDFDLMPTNSIYLALQDGQPVGVSPLIRYLENNEIN
jgi:hypothetical protein